MANNRKKNPGQVLIAEQSNSVQAKFDRAFSLHQKGQLNKAEEIYKSILKVMPRHFDSLQLLGYLAYQNGRYESAVSLISKAIEINSKFAGAFSNLGLALQALKRFDEALFYYDKAIALKSDFAEAHNNRGNALKDLKRYDEAMRAYDKAIALRPNFAEFYSNLGVVLAELKRFSEAISCYKKSIAISANYAQAYQNCGNALKAINQFEEALLFHDKAIAIQPDSPMVHHARGDVLVHLNRLEEALISYRKVIALQSDYEFISGRHLLIKMLICDWQDLEKNLAKYAADILASKKVTLPFPALALLDSPDVHKQAATIWANTAYPESHQLGPIAKRAKREKIRIGYYSADFHNHATSYLMAELFETHDRTAFELFGFSFGPNKTDEMRDRVSGAFDQFIDVSNKSDVEIARYSRQLGIDIAVDLKGFTTDSRMGIFAERCAPIQVSYLGYPGTTGTAYIDYIIADEVVIPPDSLAYYSEKVVYLPHSYQVNDSKRRISSRIFTREEMALPEKGFVFCCFNNTYKILPATFNAWMRILAAVEESVLWLLEDNPLATQRLQKEAESRGIDSRRLIFAKRMPLEEHLARHKLADLFIDTLPYNAHTTASDALWAGLPVLTCAGKSFAGRVSASLLSAVRLPELITETLEEYEAKAIKLALNAEVLLNLRHKLEANRLEAPLFDVKLFTKHIESAFRAMYLRYHGGLSAADIWVDSIN